MTRPAMMIVCDVAEEYGLTPRDLLGRSRRAPVARARMEAYARIRRDLGYSLKQIGNIFGRDHTTVIYGIRQQEAAE